jgi:hypothetical protein
VLYSVWPGDPGAELNIDSHNIFAHVTPAMTMRKKRVSKYVLAKTMKKNVVTKIGAVCNLYMIIALNVLQNHISVH